MLEVLCCREKGSLCNPEGDSSIDIKKKKKPICGFSTQTSLCVRVMAAQSRSHTANKLPLLPPRQSLGTLLSYFQHAACAGTFGCGTKLYNIMEKLNQRSNVYIKY